MKTEENRQMIHLFRLHQERLAQTQLEAVIERHAQSEADRRRVFLDALNSHQRTIALPHGNGG
jgi:hypothetical protein